MTRREYVAALAAACAVVVAGYSLAPGLGAVALVAGAVALAAADHRMTERRSARVRLRERLVEAARRNG